MDLNLEQNKPLAREITRRLLDAWRLKRGYKYRSEKRATARKLYLALMNELLYAIGMRNLGEIIEEKVSHFNQNYQLSLSVDQFTDLLSSSYVPPPIIMNPHSAEEDCEGDLFESSMDESMECVEEDEVKSTTEGACPAEMSVLQSLHGYTSNGDSVGSPEDVTVLPQQEISEIKALDTEKSAPSVDKVASVEKATTMDETDVNIVKSDISTLLSGNQKLRAEIEPMLDYREDPDMYDRIIAAELRGKKFKVSNDGKCPRCSYKKNVFVILDFLFPMGDMPEICNYLIAKGQAVLWSSQDDSHCKDPPTLLCRGKCPADPAKCGFNLNWNRTDLESIFFFPDDEEDNKNAVNEIAENRKLWTHWEAKAENSKVLHDLTNTPSKEVKAVAESTVKELITESQAIKKVEGEIISEKTEPTQEPDGGCTEDGQFDEGHVDMNYYKKDVSWVVLDEYMEPSVEADEQENTLIKTMLALSKAKDEWKQGIAKLWPEEERGEETSKENDNTKETSDKTSKQSFAFSWSSYGSNPWAPVELDKKKSQTSASRFLMVATGKAHVPLLLSKAEETTGEEENDPANTSAGEKEPKAANEVTNDTPVDSEMVSQGSTSGTNAASSSKENKSETQKKAFKADDYPVSKDGRCPYCHSQEVVYIIISDGDKSEELPGILQRLLHFNFAYKMSKDENEPPSFQCLKCTYGFNLDWRSTDLEKMFSKKLEQAENLAVKNQPVSSFQNYEYPMPDAVAMSMAYQGYYNTPMMGASFMPGMAFPPMPFGPGYFPSPTGYIPPMGFPGFIPYPIGGMSPMGPRPFRQNFRHGMPFRPLNKSSYTWTRRTPLSQSRQPSVDEKSTAAKTEPKCSGEALSANDNKTTNNDTKTSESSEGVEDKNEEEKHASTPIEADQEESPDTQAVQSDVPMVPSSSLRVQQDTGPSEGARGQCPPEHSTEPAPPGVNESTESDSNLAPPGEDFASLNSNELTVKEQEVPASSTHYVVMDEREAPSRETTVEVDERMNVTLTEDSDAVIEKRPRLEDVNLTNDTS